jgi:hypothetical protein
MSIKGKRMKIKNMSIVVIIAVMCNVGHSVYAMDQQPVIVDHKENLKIKLKKSEIYPSNLFSLCAHGKFEKATALIEDDNTPTAEVFRRNVHGSMPIHFALAHGNPDNVLVADLAKKAIQLHKKRLLFIACINKSENPYSFVCGVWPALVCIGRGDKDMVESAIKVAQMSAAAQYLPLCMYNPITSLIFSSSTVQGQQFGRDQLDRAIMNGSLDVAELLLETAGRSYAQVWAQQALENSQRDHYDSEDREVFLLSYIDGSRRSDV